MAIIHSILDKIEPWIESPSLNYFIMEPHDYPCFLQFAKLGDDYLLDIPSGNFFEDEMVKKLHFLIDSKYRKSVAEDKDSKERIMSYQVRFTSIEVNKMCYVAREIFEEILLVDEDSDLGIAMR